MKKLLSKATTTLFPAIPSLLLRSTPSSRGRSVFKCSMASPRIAKVAVAQMTSVNDIETNFKTCSRLVEDAAAEGAVLVCFPESFSFLGKKSGESLAIAQNLDGPLMERYRSLASKSKIWMSLGGFQEKGPDSAHLFNTHIIIDDCGYIRSKYRKIHLFDVDVPGNMVYKESIYTTAGDEIVVQDSPVGRLGVTVCYDLRFPELYQKIRFQHQSDVLLVPSAFTKVTGEAHWEVLLRARAIETQCYVIAAAQAGKHNGQRESYGDSIVVDPWGNIICRLPDHTSTGIATVDIDLSIIDAVRTKMPISEHRRPDVYGKASPL